MIAAAGPHHTVVVGAGLGGFTVVEQLRRLGHDGAITLVGEEAEHPYDRPPLSKQVLLGEATGPAHLRPPGGYAELALDLLRGTPATRVDSRRREVHLADGTRLPYDALVLAPGGVPRTLAGAAGSHGVHVLRTYDDAVRLREAVREAGTLTVVGGGPLGCEAAAAARSTGAQVDLVERLDGLLFSVLGPRVAAVLAARHIAAGVRLHLGTDLVAFHGGGPTASVELSDGSELASPVVLLALGITPATGWLDGSGVERTPDGAVRCDRSGRTSVPAVWAVGDAAAWQDAHGRHRRVEHWTSAVDQAAVVAAALTGEPEPPAGVPYFWSEQYASTLQAVGEVRPGTELEVHRIEEGLLALHGEGDRFDGIVALDARRLVGRARRLLRAGAGLTEARATLLR